MKIFLVKCFATSLFLFFLCFALVFYNSHIGASFGGPDVIPKLTLSSQESSCSCELSRTSLGPSLESFIQASITNEGRELHFPGLVVTSRLKDACQPLTDVSKAKIPANKIALVILGLEDETACPMPDLALEAQRAGYSVLLYFGYSANTTPIYVPSKEILLIPVLEVEAKIYDAQCAFLFANANRTDTNNAEISIQADRQLSKELKAMKSYLVRLYYWFLLGPIITLAWMIRTTFCNSENPLQPEAENQVETDAERDIRTMEEGENRTGETLPLSAFRERPERSENPSEPEAENQVETDAERDIKNIEEGENRTGESLQLSECRERADEKKPLLGAKSNDSHDVKHCPRESGHVKKFNSVCGKAAIGFGYLILVLAALPVGLSAGGVSFFRFDDAGEYKTLILFSGSSTTSSMAWPHFFLDFDVPVWWSPFQIFCFFLYSYFACGKKPEGTWTISTNFSKLIRNDWFASNIYLLALGVVEPICSFSGAALGVFIVRFALHNSIHTLCNFLFLIILNKHKVVTRYVFYISVCMICAYIESDVVALFYFALSSQGSLQNVKLTAIRTAAITLTLFVSFRSSMHIIRKLITPSESLFEGLSEQ